MRNWSRREWCGGSALSLAWTPALRWAYGAALAVPARADAQVPSAIAKLRPGEWLELPDTKIRDVAPKVPQKGRLRSVVRAWNGAAIDTSRSRMVIWGGGHSDYFGNEIYALDLPSMRMLRLTDPSPHTAEADCTAALPDGQPTSRHTYAGLAYVTHKDQLFATAGSLAPCGHSKPDVWAYDFAQRRWIALSMDGPISGYGVMAVHDSQTRLTYIKGRTDFYGFSHETRQAQKLNKQRQATDYHMTAAIDPKRRKFVMVGNGVQIIDLNDHAMVRAETRNAPAIISTKQSPGIGYDPGLDRMVVWHGGSDVYALDMDHLTWKQIAVGSGPTRKAPYQGTFGRWGYVPQFKVFALVNDVEENAWVFKASA